MKEHNPEYQPIPPEQIRAARNADIAAYLMARGEQLIPAGTDRYKLAEHDSLVITGKMYYWNSHKEHGNALDFLMSYYGMGLREAVAELTGGADKNVVPTALPVPEARPAMAKIELAPDMEHVIAYLSEQRRLSQGLVNELILSQQLFQEAKTNNAVFPIYEQHKIVGAEVVGTLPQQRFKGIKTGSKYGCGYNLSFGGETVYALFFESAIDLLSFVDLSRMRGKDLAGCRLTSMMGLKQNIVGHTLQALPEGVQPFLCVDNDEAGQNFIKAMGLKARLPDPAYKDWNDQLRAIRQY